MGSNKYHDFEIPAWFIQTNTMFVSLTAGRQLTRGRPGSQAGAPGARLETCRNHPVFVFFIWIFSILYLD